ncbi:hypothetical protein GCM10010193_38940 [Kitasatospora atroaurantiaca]|uniref:Uncharacterized protein n=1 Tax=Kitasatospora atroaurantiaca TaxID=285545 RepID=A0A561EU76_9ACTN|nr:hypothetical protein [Kitasatospora atroaurantiaca]TWE19172.1 hypothetical protein FB465_4281 [Kitasatospora atroaurantiaca]
MEDLFDADASDHGGVFDKVFAVSCLALNLFLLDLGVTQHREGGSIGWAVAGGVLVLLSCCETVRRFRPRR